MNKVLSCAAILLVLLGWSSCNKAKVNNSDESLATELYKELSATYQIYCDSLTNSNDSTDVTEVLFRLDERIRRIYDRYPADLDYKITEAQNDTLWKLVNRIADYRHKKQIVAHVDSLFIDSLSITDVNSSGTVE